MLVVSSLPAAFSLSSPPHSLHLAPSSLTSVIYVRDAAVSCRFFRDCLVRTDVRWFRDRRHASYKFNVPIRQTVDNDTIVLSTPNNKGYRGLASTQRSRRSCHTVTRKHRVEIGLRQQSRALHFRVRRRLPRLDDDLHRRQRQRTEVRTEESYGELLRCVSRFFTPNRVDGRRRTRAG